MDDARAAEILDLEHQGWGSLCDGNGVKFHGAPIADAIAIALGPDHVILRYAGTGRPSWEPDFAAWMVSLCVRIDSE